jgi:hypothetical protein
MFVKRRFVLLILIASVVLSSCGGQATDGDPTLDVNAIMTAGIGTFVASLNQTQTAQALLNTHTPSPTVTSSPTSTATPTAGTPVVLNPILPGVVVFPTITGTQYTPTSNPSVLASGCNNLGFIQDVTVPSGSVMRPGQEFTKTWKVVNTGTCDWVFLYRLVFTGGERMAGDPGGLGKVIIPGKWTQLSVTLTAPRQGGTYTGYWRMGTQSGVAFGATLAVSIVVGNPTNTPVPPTSTPSYP